MDGYELHGTISLLGHRGVAGEVPPGQRGVPGVGWDEGGPGGCTTGYPPGTLQDPYLVIFKPRGPTYGQMKLYLRYSMRFPRYDPQIDPPDPHIDPQIDPPDLVPRWSRDGLRSLYPRTSDIL